MTRKERALAAMRGSDADHLAFMPITMMVAADAAGVPYKRYATEAPLQAEGQFRIAESFGAAHVSAISDPGVEASDLGAWVGYPEDSPPHVDEARAFLEEKGVLSGLRVVEPSSGPRMANRLEALRLLSERGEDDLLVEGWVEGPCAESADLRGLSRLMMDFFDDEPFVSDLLDFVTAQAILFVQYQIDAGADIIGIGDAAASLIGPEIYEKWIVPRVRRYIEAIHAAGALVRLHICGRTQELAPAIAALGVDMVDVDAGNDLAVFREALGPGGAALAGNLDPVRELRDGDPDSIRRRLAECQDESGAKYIVGAGCEVPRGTSKDCLLAMRVYAEKTSGEREIGNL